MISACKRIYFKKFFGAFYIAAVLISFHTLTFQSAYANRCEFFLNNPATYSIQLENRYTDEQSLHIIAIEQTPTNRRNIGELEATRIDNNSIKIDNLYVAESYRNLGISKALLKQVLNPIAKNPVLVRELVEDNMRAFIRYYDRTLDPKDPVYQPHLLENERNIEAVKQTPAFRASLAFGYNKIIDLRVKWHSTTSSERFADIDLSVSR